MKTTALTTFFIVCLFASTPFFDRSESNTELQTYITSCDGGTEQFASFGSDRAFLMKHDNPLPLDYQQSGEMITYPVSDGNEANAYFIKSPEPSSDYLFVVHEWWGLNDYVKRESDRLTGELGNINVIALDLYDGKVAETRENASKYMQSVKTERAHAIIAGAQSLAGPEARVFTIGWCFGGGWSLQTAIELGEQAKGAVMFYGMPETDKERLDKLECDVLGLFASNERWITPAIVRQFEADMESLDQNLTTKSYDAEHGFANPSNPRFNEEATKDAYALVTDFIQSRR